MCAATTELCPRTPSVLVHVPKLPVSYYTAAFVFEHVRIDTELRGLSHRGVCVSITGGSAELQPTKPGKSQQLPSIRINEKK